jgi:hypothetical protein
MAPRTRIRKERILRIVLAFQSMQEREENVVGRVGEEVLDV